MHGKHWFSVFISLLLVGMVGLWGPIVALADDDDKDKKLRADPVIFVGKAGDCGPNYPAGSRIVTSAWLGGLGLPDNGGQNVGPNPADNPNKNDPHRGLLLNKNGTTADCSSAGAIIKGAEGDVLTELGFDYRNGGHCGGGAPRFNVVVRNSVTNTDTFHFVGNCAVGTNSPAPQDPAQWTRIRFTPAQASPPIPPGSRIKSLAINFDEGTDQNGAQDPNGVGLQTIDNIDVNGRLITSGKGIADGPNGNGPKDKDDDDD